MGCQTMGSQSNGHQQQSNLQPCHLSRENSWYSLTLEEVETQLGDLGLKKPLGSMKLDELVKNVWSNSDLNESIGKNDDSSTSSASSLRRQASLTLACAFSGKTVDQVWREILQGQKKRYGEEKKEQILGEVTLEEFLVKAGLFADSLSSPSKELVLTNRVETPENSQQKIMLSSAISADALLETASGQKRDASEALEMSIERRLRRKIKNRESAARSRARKQAYHNELVSKVSRLEEKNILLKKEKEFDMKHLCEISEQKYQLRRTSSSVF